MVRVSTILTGTLRSPIDEPDPLRRRAKEILAAMPPVPEIYWHGKDGRPCPCSSCSSAALRMLAPELAALVTVPEKKSKRRRN